MHARARTRTHAVMLFVVGGEQHIIVHACDMTRKDLSCFSVSGSRVWHCVSSRSIVAICNAYWL